MSGYKLATHLSASGPRAAIVLRDRVFDAAKLTGRTADSSVLGILHDWPAAGAGLAAAAASTAANSGTALTGGEPLAAVTLLAPVLWPSAIYCAGANYADHAAEMARANNRTPEPDPHTLGLKPWHFIKAGRSTLAGPDATGGITGRPKT